MSQPLPTTETPATATFALTLTGRAIEKVKEFAAKMPEAEGKSLRVFIQGGGCSGFQYGFTFDDRKPSDTIVAAGDITVLVDPASAPKLQGASVDWVEDMRGAGFSVDNPGATSSCGCGKSFC